MDDPEAISATTGPTPLVGEAPAFRAMLERVSVLAPVPRPIVVLGERGTGKELVAERLHFLSPRWDRPFVKVNCAALGESLLDAELFGHEAGAFTGATRRRIGRFEAAHGGTLFLDEIGTMPSLVQEKVLRVIEYGTFERLGSSTTLTVDVRLVCATNADLPAMAAAGTFRADLLDRLAFAVVRMPPLRERREDIPDLAEHFARGMTRDLGRPYFAGFSRQAMDRFLAHPWPGNVRELKNAAERAVALAEDPDAPVADVAIDPFGPLHAPAHGPAHAPPHAPPPPPPAADASAPPEPAAPPPVLPADFDSAVEAHARALLSQAMEEARFNQKEAARALGLDYHRFRRLLKKHDVA